MRLSDLTQDQRTITLHLDAGDLTCTYRPSGYTAAVELELLEHANSRPLTSLVNVLSSLLVSWDLMDGEKPLPIRKETLSQLPAQFLLSVLQGIMEDMKPDPTRLPASNAGS